MVEQEVYYILSGGGMMKDNIDEYAMKKVQEANKNKSEFSHILAEHTTKMHENLIVFYANIYDKNPDLAMTLLSTNFAAMIMMLHGGDIDKSINSFKTMIPIIEGSFKEIDKVINN